MLGSMEMSEYTSIRVSKTTVRGIKVLRGLLEFKGHHDLSFDRIILATIALSSHELAKAYNLTNLDSAAYVEEFINNLQSTDDESERKILLEDMAAFGLIKEAEGSTDMPGSIPNIQPSAHPPRRENGDMPGSRPSIPPPSSSNNRITLIANDCPACGAPYTKEDRKCPRCGRDV